MERGINMPHSPFHEALQSKIDAFVAKVYESTQNFPKSEVFGVTSQIRRAALSVALNYVEGYARLGVPTNRHFLEMAYGSLKETNYLIRFSHQQHFINEGTKSELLIMTDELGAMLWRTIEIKKKSK